MTKEEFNKLWKDSTKEEILNQYYYDYKELQRTSNIINELEKKIISICETCYENRETARIEKWIKALKGDSSNE